MTQDWNKETFAKINVSEIAQKSDFYVRMVNRCEKNMRENPVLTKLKNMVFSFKETMPVVTALRNPHLTEKHRAEIDALFEAQNKVNIY